MCDTIHVYMGCYVCVCVWAGSKLRKRYVEGRLLLYMLYMHAHMLCHSEGDTWKGTHNELIHSEIRGSPSDVIHGMQ